VLFCFSLWRFSMASASPSWSRAFDRLESQAIDVETAAVWVLLSPSSNLQPTICCWYCSGVPFVHTSSKLWSHLWGIYMINPNSEMNE
jgi:hypothetical protein